MQEDRKQRIIARGELSDHAHVVTGDAVVERDDNGNIVISVGSEGAVIKHLLESAWLEGNEVWTKEHEDIIMKPNKKYNYVPQEEYDPFAKIIREVLD